MTIGELLGRIGQGMAAGLVGTAAMTASAAVEMHVRHRPPSTTPAKAVESILEVEPTTAKAETRLADLTHWSYGTAWGGVRGLIGAIGFHGPLAAVLHFATTWGTELLILPRLGVTPPVAEWGSTELGIDALHHAVYATATSAAYEFLAG